MGRVLLLVFLFCFLLWRRSLEYRRAHRQEEDCASSGVADKIDMFFAMKSILFAFAFLFIVSSLRAQEFKDFGRDRLNSSPRHGEWVDIKSGDRTIKPFVVYPERKDKAPVVLVIHEIFGLTDWVRSLCDELAENGVIAIAPDLHSGQKLEDLDAARKATSALPKEQVKADLDATSNYALTKIPAC